MNKRMLSISAGAAMCALVFYFPVKCHSMASVSLKQEKSPGDFRRESTGFYGGQKGDRLLLVLAPGVRKYFAIDTDSRVIMNGRPVGFGQLPGNAHIRVISDKGVVRVVEVLEEN